ncbi:MAG: magnesium transporter [Microthrixaceae bacterium]
MGRTPRSVGRIRPDRALRRFVDLLGPSGGAARQSLGALVLNSTTSFAAGAMLVGFEPTWRRLAPMLILVPAAIGLRGNVYSTMGNRLSTAIHTGTFRLSFRRDSVLAQNLAASFALTAILSVVLAVFAKVLATALDTAQHVSVLELICVSVLGGLLGSAVVAAVTVALTFGAVRFEWDLDYLVSPTVSTIGDVATIPALWLAAQLVIGGAPANAIGALLVLVAVAAAVWAFRTRLVEITQICRESLPVLAVAIALSGFAGVILQSRQRILTDLPTVGVLQPAFVSSAGALGGILCGRVATNLHLGSVRPTMIPGSETRRDFSLIAWLAGPVLLFNAAGVGDRVGRRTECHARVLVAAPRQPHRIECDDGVRRHAGVLLDDCGVAVQRRPRFGGCAVGDSVGRLRRHDGAGVRGGPVRPHPLTGPDRRI